MKIIEPTYIIYDMKLSTFQGSYVLDEVLDYNGYISIGGFSEVYDLSPYFVKPCVLKVTSDEAFLSYVEFIYKHQENPLVKDHIPLIYDMKLIDEDDGVYGILMEKLDHHNLLISDSAECQGYYGKEPELWYDFKELKPLFELLEKWREDKSTFNDLEWDLRDNNIMLRGETLVVTDPFFQDDGIY